jgi:hypothetical protein
MAIPVMVAAGLTVAGVSIYEGIKHRDGISKAFHEGLDGTKKYLHKTMDAMDNAAAHLDAFLDKHESQIDNAGSRVDAFMDKHAP